MDCTISIRHKIGSYLLIAAYTGVKLKVYYLWAVFMPWLLEHAIEGMVASVTILYHIPGIIIRWRNLINFIKRSKKGRAYGKEKQKRQP